MRKVILRNFQSPGDVLMLTAAVRDLHAYHPGRFQTDVRTSCPALWLHNPHLTPLDEDDAEVECIDCEYPLIHRSNQEPWHFLHGFIHDLSGKLEVPIEPRGFGGDLYLTDEELASPGPLEAMIPPGRSWWIVAAGGKFDFTIKWWCHHRYQEVVERLRDRVTMVQIGLEGHFHPRLKGTVDLRGRTTLRDLIRLTYHSFGVVCGVTFLMHLAGALPQVPGRERARGGVIIGGGRESPHWEAYPGHQFLHTIGMLPCCFRGGCWRSRTVPLDDDEHHNDPKHLCVDVVDGLPRCMDMITADDVVRQVERWI